MMKVNDLIQGLNLEEGIVVIVGAGASVASGLQTFRGKNGMYLTEGAEELANPYTFEQRPYDVWAWYAKRIEKVLETKPSDVHYALVELENLGLIKTVITQNVDGLHRIAGQRKLIEIHGTILNTHCFKNCGETMKLDQVPSIIPLSCKCGSYQRPSVIWFNEPLDQSALILAEDSIENCALVLTIGTSGTVYPVALLPLLAHRLGIPVIDFNISATPISDLADIFIQDPAEHTVPKFVELLTTMVNEKHKL